MCRESKSKQINKSAEFMKVGRRWGRGHRRRQREIVANQIDQCISYKHVTLSNDKRFGAFT